MTSQDATPLPDDWEQRDSHDGFFLGVQLAKQAVERGEPVPMWLRSRGPRPVTEQLDLLVPNAAEPKAGADRFHECRRRVSSGCGGHHEPGELWQGSRFMNWVCCADCPDKAELNPWAVR